MTTKKHDLIFVLIAFLTIFILTLINSSSMQQNTKIDPYIVKKVYENTIGEPMIEQYKRQENKTTTKQYQVQDFPVLYRTEAKRYMDYRCISDTTSNQYKYIHSGKIRFCSDGFLRTYDGYYGVALGSAFGKIGNKYIFVLEDGNTISVVKIEEKADRHTEKNNYAQASDKSVIEFVVDVNKIAPEMLLAGDMAVHENYEGMIEKIYKIIK